MINQLCVCSTYLFTSYTSR